jgi:S1-C subfamily serine protease
MNAMPSSFPAILAIMFAICQAASAAECGNCSGCRVVGEGPIRWACPICEGSGTLPDPPTTGSAAAPAAIATARPAAATASGPRPGVARVSASRGPVSDIGSGVLVESGESHGIVLTNWHVVRDAREQITVHWPDGTKTPGRLLAWDATWDLAAIKVPRPAAEPVTITASAPRIGDPITIAGFGPEGRYREQTGAVTDYLSPARHSTRQLVEMRGTARKGDSGGPMFNAQGELAGVLFGQADGLTIGPCSTRVAIFLAGIPRPPVASACADGRCAKR